MILRQKGVNQNFDQSLIHLLWQRLLYEKLLFSCIAANFDISWQTNIRNENSKCVVVGFVAYKREFLKDMVTVMSCFTNNKDGTNSVKCR